MVGCDEGKDEEWGRQEGCGEGYRGRAKGRRCKERDGEKIELGVGCCRMR